ncbi:MAG: hypothetical protein ABSH53_05155 [Holophaga sp.]|jgi:hypothetical protein
MFGTLDELIQEMEESKREVEERIKARAQTALQWKPTLKIGNNHLPPSRLRVPRLRVQGRTMYTSASRFSKK